MMTRDRACSVFIVRRVAPAEVLLGLLEPDALPTADNEDWSLVLGPAPRKQLNWRQVRKLVYAAAEPRATDLFYAPPFGSVINGALVPDGTVGVEHIPRFPRP